MKKYRFTIILLLFLLICFLVFRWTENLMKNYIVYPKIIFAYIWTYAFGILLALEGIGFRLRFRLHAAYLALALCFICVDVLIGAQIRYYSFALLLRIAAGFCSVKAVAAGEA